VCGTIKLLKLGALVRISVRRIKVAMASACPYQNEFGLTYARLRNAASAEGDHWNYGASPTRSAASTPGWCGSQTPLRAQKPSAGRSSWGWPWRRLRRKGELVSDDPRSPDLGSHSVTVMGADKPYTRDTQRPPAWRVHGSVRKLCDDRSRRNTSPASDCCCPNGLARCPDRLGDPCRRLPKLRRQHRALWRRPASEMF
jgi:hypothetical protein